MTIRRIAADGAIMINNASSPRATGRSILARCLVGAAALGLGGTAIAGDQVAGALFGAGAGAIIGHSVAGPDAAILGGVIGAVTGAALTASSGRSGGALPARLSLCAAGLLSRAAAGLLLRAAAGLLRAQPRPRILATRRGFLGPAAADLGAGAAAPRLSCSPATLARRSAWPARPREQMGPPRPSRPPGPLKASPSQLP